MTRLGVLKPTANTPTLLVKVSSNYFLSVIITNLNQNKNADLTIYVKPFGSTGTSQYAYVLYNFPLEIANTLETNRFATNPLDEIWIESSISEVSFVCVGIPQPLSSVRYTSGADNEYPASPTAGDLYYNTTFNTLNLYKPNGWKIVTTSA